LLVVKPTARMVVKAPVLRETPEEVAGAAPATVPPATVAVVAPAVAMPPPIRAALVVTAPAAVAAVAVVTVVTLRKHLEEVVAALI
jgi:hypothetical protein